MTTLMVYKHNRANRQYEAMTDDEVWRFLFPKEKIFVAFPMKNGFPHLSPVWFCLLDKKIFWGRSRIVFEEDLVERIEKVLKVKYRTQQWKASQMPKWWVQERKAEKRAYIEITPEKISSWDNRKVGLHPRT